jgi:hypothetical protein
MGYCGLDTHVPLQRPVAGSYKHGNEPSGAVKVGKFVNV